MIRWLVYGMIAVVPGAPFAAWWFENPELLWLLAVPVIFFSAG